MLTNIEIAELLARESEDHEGNKQKAARRAARAALGWPEEVSDVVAGGRKPTELAAVGPWVATRVRSWLDDPPEEPVGATTELRTDFRSLASARALLRDKGFAFQSFHGDLQMHSTYSDGSVSIQEMARAALEKDYSYVAITDHSKGLRIAGGMDEDTLASQGREIDDLNAYFEDSGVDFRVLRSIEMNLSPDGSGDMERNALTGLDLVLGSFHSQLRRKEDQTQRYIAGLRNPDVQVLGHPRCRMWNFRLGLVADWQRVFEEATTLGKAVEIDAHPNRQDLNVDLLKLAAATGVHVSIGTDAHAPFEMDFVEIGIAAALEAGIPTDRILNLKPLEDLLEWVEAVRAG